MRTRTLLAVISLSVLPGAALASGGASETSPSRREEPAMAAARKAVDAKAWPEAVRLLNAALEKIGPSADAYNLLGYSERQQGHLDAAFGHYEAALRLDPRHRGAHEYVGEAYLMVGNLAKAEEHLKALDKLCTFSCEEYRDLKKSIAAYKRAHKPATP
jgi:tetratricopeptide (TPR) repeat protein